MPVPHPFLLVFKGLNEFIVKFLADILIHEGEGKISTRNRFEEEMDDWRAISHRYNSNTQTEQQHSPSLWPTMYPTPQQHYEFIREMYDREDRLLDTEARNSRRTLIYFAIAIIVVYCLIKLGVI